MDETVLAFDFGASSGRAVLARYDGKSIKLTETHRFDNVPVMQNGTFYWDALALFREILTGIAKTVHGYKGFKSIGIDTWGVDFGLLDKSGGLLQNPVHYRDRRTDGIIQEVLKNVSPKKLYGLTGIEIIKINTLFQLYALKSKNPDLLKAADCALLMPDLLGYFLTGMKTAEYSIASTTQLLSPETKQWDNVLMRNLGLPENIFPEVVPSSTVLGGVLPSLSGELGIDGVKVISVAGHDTACAVAAVPAEEEDFIFISCGTWSLLGTELESPVITEKSRSLNITNEGGAGGKINFLENITGLWLIQETRRQYRREGKEYSYDAMEKAARKSRPFGYFIDPNAQEFSVPGNIPERIRSYCLKTGQGKPETPGEIIRCIYESLAMAYRLAMKQIEACTCKRYKKIYLIGGGSKDTFLCQMTSNSTGCLTVAGPAEATAMGNAAIQFIAQGYIKDVSAARRIIADSIDTTEYMPENSSEWDKAYVKYRSTVLQ